ncbi:hypothetical protein BY458DRAFT_504359 [Sporodiniella umbellata]|nr:hypothetical protein BY458DRAFT_504359 [Sporodiniella umbellata]
MSIVLIPIYSYFVRCYQFLLPSAYTIHLNSSSTTTWLLVLLIFYYRAAVRSYFCQNLIDSPELIIDSDLTISAFEQKCTRDQRLKKRPKGRKNKKTKTQNVSYKDKKKEETKELLHEITLPKLKKAQSDSLNNEAILKHTSILTCVDKKTEKQIVVDNQMPTPDVTPSQSEDEALGSTKIQSWYSPFSTGLDLDILPKFTIDPLCHYKVNLTPPSSPLIPTVLHHQHLSSLPASHSIIELLENHPFISINQPHHQHQHTLGPIGDQKPKQIHK